MDQNRLYRGLLRGFTSDVVGGPADIAEQLANLGIAGYGYVGNKLGLLDASQLPKLLEASPGTSEWFARLAKNADDGSGEYLAGRLVPAAVGLARAGGPALLNRLEELPKAASAGTKAAQRGAIRVGGAPDLYLGHTGSVSSKGWSKLAGKGPALYGNSFGITAGKVPNFREFLDDSGGMLLLPRLGALDPASYPTRVWNRDAYVLRSQYHPGVRLMEDGESARNVAPQLLKDKGLAARNLAFTEGDMSMAPPHKSNNSDAHKAVLLNSPEFRSFADFERSPGGAEVLRKYNLNPWDDSARLYEDYQKEAVDLFFRHFANATPEEGEQVDRVMQSLLYYPAEKRANALNKLAELNSGFAMELAGLAKGYRKQFSEIPSEYGEVQNYGLLPLTPENFAGAFVTERGAGDYSRQLQASLGDVPVIPRKPGRVTTADLDQLLEDAGPARTARKGLIKSFGGFEPVGPPRHSAVSSEEALKELEYMYGSDWWNNVTGSDLSAFGAGKSPEVQKAILGAIQNSTNKNSNWKSFTIKNLTTRWGVPNPYKAKEAPDPWAGKGLAAKPQSTVISPGFFTKVVQAKASPHDVNTYKNALFDSKFNLDDELKTLLILHKDSSWAPETLAALIDAALATKQFFPGNLAEKYPEFAHQWPELFLPK